MRRFCVFATTCMFFIAVPLEAQLLSSVPSIGSLVPNGDAELTQAEKLITDQPLPAASSMYEAQTEASNKIGGLQSYIDSLNQQLIIVKKAHGDFPKNLANLTKARPCPSNIYSQLRPGFYSESPVEDQGADRLNELLAGLNMFDTESNKKLCEKLKDPKFVADLQNATDMMFTGREKFVTSRIANATRLQSAWQKRLSALNEQAKAEQGKQQTTQDLVSSLPWIVLILSAFSIGMFACVRLFGPAIQLELVTSGQVIQFPTVMVLLVVIVSLGLVHVLNENSLSALLGGLAGYVLSQGIGRSSSKTGVDGKADPPVVNPLAVAFPDQKIGTTSAAQPVTVLNPSPLPRNITVSVTGEFSESHGGQATLGPRGIAVIQVSFTPSSTGPKSGSITIGDGAIPQTVKLSGTGI